MTAAAFGSAAEATTEPAGGSLAEYGEDPSAADPALVEKALGPVEPSARGQLGHRARGDRPGRPGPRPGHHRQGPGVLERSVVRHRHGWRAGHGLRRRWRRHGERLAFGESHGGHPPSADVPGDRLDRLDRRQLQPGSGGPCQRREVPDPERRRLHRRVSRRGHRPRRSRRPKRRPPGSRICPSRPATSDCPARRAPSFLARTTRR